MAQTNKRSSGGKKRSTAKRPSAARRRKRRVNVPAFAGLTGVLTVLLVFGVVLLAQRSGAESGGTESLSANLPAETTTTVKQEGTTMAQTTTTAASEAEAAVTTGSAASGESGQTTTSAAATTSTATETTTTGTVTEATTTQTALPQEAQPTYIQGILIVNKTYSLPSTYAPGDLDPKVKAQFDVMQKAAAAEGLNLYISSGYRSYDYQKRIYNNNVAAYGAEKTDTFSARPGHSEHQTGLAFDLNTINDAFALTPESDWVKAHAHEYGFIVRYPEGKSHITGYKYEPWHLRYLGVDTATAVYNSGLTLEEYLGIDSVYAD